MSAPSPAEIIAEVERAGGHLAFKPPNTLSVDLPSGAEPLLLPLLKEHKAEVLLQLEPLCLKCGGMYRWKDSAGMWHCGYCEPDPGGHLWQGVELADLGGRAFVLTPPTGDLPAIREWVKTPLGWATVLACSLDGGDVFVRLFRPARRGPFTWLPSHSVVSELDTE
ncbi:MAG TPA: hypothetical protein VMV31_06730 [Terriglobales bacterium]|nr:hypothetical protein [Terriglobales bacterium]